MEKYVNLVVLAMWRLLRRGARETWRGGDLEKGRLLRRGREIQLLTVSSEWDSYVLFGIVQKT